MLLSVLNTEETSPAYILLQLVDRPLAFDEDDLHFFRALMTVELNRNQLFSLSDIAGFETKILNPLPEVFFFLPSSFAKISYVLRLSCCQLGTSNHSRYYTFM